MSPYIHPSERIDVDSSLKYLMKDLDTVCTPGKLNYVITRLADYYVRRKGAGYTTFNDVIGVLEAAKLEFYRRLVADYEDQKRAENGEVYESLVPAPLSNAEVEALIIQDDSGNTWFKCPDEPDCDLHVVGPGRVYCAHCDPDEGDESEE